MSSTYFFIYVVGTCIVSVLLRPIIAPVLPKPYNLFLLPAAKHNFVENEMDFLEKKEEGQLRLQVLHSLRNKRAKLQSQLKALSRQTFDVDTCQDAARSDDSDQYHKLLDILESYRLLGISIATTENSLILRFDSLYGNQYPSTDSHCVQLIKKGDDYVVGQHNLPLFIPVQQLEKKHLATSTAMFASEVRNYLYAYVQRREGVRQVQEEFAASMVGQVNVNLPVTFVEMRLCVDDSLPDIEVRLHYDYLRCLPDSTDIAFVEEMNRSNDTPTTNKKMDRLLVKWKACLADQNIYSAVKKLLTKR